MIFEYQKLELYVILQQVEKAVLKALQKDDDKRLKKTQKKLLKIIDESRISIVKNYMPEVESIKQFNAICQAKALANEDVSLGNSYIFEKINAALSGRY